MDVIFSACEAKKFIGDNKTAVALGMFDGIHLGHAAVLQKLTSVALRSGIPSVVFTFDRHPVSVLKGLEVPNIVTQEEKIALIEKHRVDCLLFWPFDQELASMTPQDFISEILLGTLNAAEVVVGYNYTFGAGAQGDPDALRELGARQGIRVHIVPPIIINGVAVASTEIRRLLLEGKVKDAGVLLGRPFSLTGVVEKGRGIGRSLGFPTANFEFPGDIIQLANGVYAVKLRIYGRIFLGVANVGFRPTFNGKNKLVEIYVMDAELDLYGERITVYFIERIREEIRFNSAADLARQIQVDVKTAMEILKSPTYVYTGSKLWYNVCGIGTPC
ncbi:MAG TPA: bifunctional riboflavin kinase/FAD synthetase [Firmicutes bacterium]|nr:bifunctional riboflavin kinase/FAD synthetase [Bacillota bacterium]HHY98122.1 bifunctional riboflavin kinase/FAD synthetase [Bacillota bacterium]